MRYVEGKEFQKTQGTPRAEKGRSRNERRAGAYLCKAKDRKQRRQRDMYGDTAIVMEIGPVLRYFLGERR
jgi:hypothetical protein